MNRRARTTCVTGLAALSVVALAAPASAAPGAAGAQHSALRAPRCAETQLHASIDSRPIPGNGAVGPDGRRVHAVLVDLRNTSRRTCTLTGYPGAAIQGFTGSQVRQATRTTHGPYGSRRTTVTLRPHRSAAAYLVGEKSRTPGNCGERYPRILVTPPNTSRPVGFRTGWPKCYSFLVHPVRTLRSTR